MKSLQFDLLRFHNLNSEKFKLRKLYSVILGLGKFLFELRLTLCEFPEELLTSTETISDLPSKE